MREIFSFWTGNPFDFELWVRTGYWVAQGVSPYGVLQPAPGLSFTSVYSPQSESTIGYLTFWPLLLGAIYKLYTVVGLGDRFVYYFLIKQPIIAGDILLGYIISAYVRARRVDIADLVLALWLFSPLTIILSGIWGMFDSLAMLPVVAALGVRNGSFRSLSEGLAIWVKSIPLIYAVPLALSGKNRFRNISISVALPAAASLATFWILGWPFGTAVTTLATTASKQGQSMSALGFVFYLQQFNLIGPLPGALAELQGLIWVPALLGATLLSYRWFGFNTERGLVQSLLMCTCTFMIFKAQVNEQYSIYLLALILIDLTWEPDRKRLYIATTAVVLAFLLVNNTALVRFIAPIYPEAVNIDTSLNQSLGGVRFGMLFVASIAFVALNVYYIVLLYRGEAQFRCPELYELRPGRGYRRRS